MAPYATSIDCESSCPMGSQAVRRHTWALIGALGGRMLLRRVKTAPDDRQCQKVAKCGGIFLFKQWKTFLGWENCETFTNLEKKHTEMVASYISCLCIRKPDLCMDWSAFYLILDFIGCLTIHQPTKACERPRAKSPVRFAPRRARRTPLPAK